ncbi:MarR family winged helix-turn-helix transcriptional regulator [Shewanella sp. Isolate11]|uniref:MarR family winged helix-turn-helix transcriptional regulator n=1 Tax=Shewanella sp. Isolate11 TaxID=2908530 RepID=UPI001EFC38CD|nr:MarR family winged helix-turn-helix transcriptional regulator [Shewanella sp. Isolate11]MCG9697679.1 MarR family winged helix-turn-helix transcriptional regulator [Shewanella sp. Isolate11]
MKHSTQQPSVGYLLTDIIRLARKQFQNDPRLTCITMAQARALGLISRYEGIKQVELAERLEIKPMSLVRVIDSLVDEGLVERRSDPSDRRAHLLYLVPAAEERMEKVRCVSQDIWARGLDGFSTSQVNEFIASLEQIHSNLSKGNE